MIFRLSKKDVQIIFYMIKYYLKGGNKSMNRLVKRLTDNGSKLSKIYKDCADYCESQISEDALIGK